jgi:hypothetical protein
MADRKSLQISKALAATEDAKHRHQQFVPGREPYARQYACVWDRLEVADQVEIDCSRGGVRHKAGQARSAHPMLATPARAPMTNFASTMGADLLGGTGKEAMEEALGESGSYGSGLLTIESQKKTN